MFLISWISAKTYENIGRTEWCSNSGWGEGRHRECVVLLEALSMPDNTLKLHNFNTVRKSSFSCCFCHWGIPPFHELHQQSISNGILIFLKATSSLLGTPPKYSGNCAHILVLSMSLRRQPFLILRSQSGLRTPDTLFLRLAYAATKV